MIDRRSLPVVGLLLALIACQPVARSSSPTASATVPASAGSPSPSAAATSPPSPSPTPVAAIVPGRPYDSQDVLQAMRASRRPGGVPDQLEREAIARAVADGLWTIDGRPWQAMVAGGSCGPQLCTLEIAGALPGAIGEDLYVFEVRPATSAVTLQAAELRGLDAALVTRLDEFARAHWPSGAALPGLLTSARWLPPPDDGTFVLSYRSGGEEGSAAVDAVLDAAALSVELREPGT